MTASKRAKSPMDLCEGPFLKKILIYTVPIILTGLLQLLFNAADLVVVGQFCGENSVGAVGATGSLITLLVNLFMGFATGAGVCVAQGLGAKDEKLVHRTIHTAIPGAVVCGVFLTVVGMLFSGTFLEWMKTPAEQIELSTVYLKIYFAGVIPMLLYNFGAAILRAAGDTRTPLIFLSISGVLNVLLNVLFVWAFDLNVAGVALATTISQTLSCVLVMIELTRRKDEIRLDLRKLRFYKKALVRIVRIGLPAGLQGSMFAISNVIIQSSVNSLGSVVLNGSAASSSIEGFVYTVMVGFQQTVMNFVGQNIGAGKTENVRKITRICLCCVVASGMIVGSVAVLLRRPLLSIYLGSSEASIAFGSERLIVIATTYFLCGIMDVLSGALRGMGYSVQPMILCVFGVCVLRIVWIMTVFAMEAYHTLSVLVASWPLSWLITSIALAVTYLICYRKAFRRRASY